MSARGSLRLTELAAPYLATEQAAQEARLGIWSVTLPTAVTQSAVAEAAARASAAKTEVPENAVEANDKQPEQNKEETPPVTAESIQTKAEPAAVSPVLENAFPHALLYGDSQRPQAVVASMGFFERYQLLVTGLLMMLTVVGIVAVVLFQRWADKREEVRSVAAALRGELMAARAVCLARLAAAEGEKGAKGLSWPRIRILVFQAYVGRLGLLGAVLSRQIASIYGQASDYFAYYATSDKKKETKSGNAPIREALQTLVGHIEEVLPKLAHIEQGTQRQYRLALAQPESSIAALLPPTPALEGPAPMPTEFSDHEDIEIEETPKAFVKERKSDETRSAKENEPRPLKKKPVAQEPKKRDESVKTAEKTAPLWDAIKKVATERLEKVSMPLQASPVFSRSIKPATMEDHIPDYTALSEEEEMEALAYGGDLDDIDLYFPDKGDRTTKTG